MPFIIPNPVAAAAGGVIDPNFYNPLANFCITRTGGSINTTMVNMVSGNNGVYLDTTQMPDGIYLLEITSISHTSGPYLTIDFGTDSWHCWYGSTASAGVVGAQNTQYKSVRVDKGVNNHILWQTSFGGPIVNPSVKSSWRGAL